MKKQRLYIINKVCDERGALSVCELADKNLPFQPKRMFWITGVPEEAARGGHAHATCNELLFVLSGRCALTVGDGNGEQRFDLEAAPEKGVAIWAGEWCDLTDFAPGTVLLVLASEPYDPSGYTHSRDEFERQAAANK